jgi:hypothetical protein
VVARLLALNAERAADEQRSGATAGALVMKKSVVSATALRRAEGLF